MTAAVLTFDKLAYIDRLKAAGISEDHARAQAEALDVALRDTVATKRDLNELRTELRHEIQLAVRDMTIRTGGMMILLFGALASIKFFG